MLNKKPLKFTFIDMAVIIVIIAVISLFFSRMNQVLAYKWEWGAIPSYFFFLDPVTGKLKANILIIGFFTTIKLSIWSTL
ncbi:MAG: amino acid ABC transporter permease, partial [Desulfobacula sp.]|nr:amino acid ABC transporter permease [Desulfobacula sp.]